MSDAAPQRFAAPRGISDVLPDDWPWWRHLRDTAEEVCDLYGYRRIETPVLEQAGVYLRTAGAGTDIVEKEVYLFEDRGGDRLALRPEGTAGVARAYIEHGMGSLPQPVRLFYIAQNFRYDRPQAGRYRQHTQFGIECIGDGSPLVDAEVIALLMTYFAKLGLQGVTLRLNTIGDENCRPAYIDRLREYYRPLLDKVCADDRARFEKNPLRLLDCKEDRCQPIIADAPRLAEYLCDACREHFARVQEYLNTLGISYELDERLVRGLDYYTRTVFEAHPSVEGAQSSLGSGGRYDGLIELLGGQRTPGIGFGSGFERVILNLKRQEAELEYEPTPTLFIAPLVPEASVPALRIAESVRNEDLQAIIGSEGRSLKTLLRHASLKAASFTAIIGAKELESGNVTLRNMISHDERAVPFDEVVDAVRP